MIYQIATAAFVGLVSASALSVTPAANGRPVFERYIVRLADDSKVEALREHVQAVRTHLGISEDHVSVFENLAEHKTVGYAIKLSKVGVEFLSRHSDVVSIEEDQEVFLHDSCVSEKNPDWGLARINHHNYTSSSTYTYDYTTGSTGAGVDAYVIDTGIYCENNEFTQKTTGSCTFGASFVKKLGKTDETDGNGHGTHCAGTIGGETYGVAKEVDLIAVKVMSDAGSGSSSNILSGIDWVVGKAKTSGKRSVANLSIGGGFSQTENDAIAAAVDAGVTMVVAAGNEDSDACDTSPASAPDAITVGATDDSNTRASYSNYGACLDVFGPGSQITSAWIDAEDATNTISGTSMATPHVVGIVANYLSQDDSLTVAQVTAKVIADASVDEVSDLKGSPNLLAYSACV